MIPNPLVSLVILNWNGKKWLQQCLPSLYKVTYSPLEIIVVNNGSTDDSGLFLKKYYPKVCVVDIKVNIGYAAANNVGVQHTKGKYVLLMNNDTKVTPAFIEPMVRDLEADKTIGAVQPQMRSLINPKQMDSVGSYLTSTGFLYYLGYMKPYKNPLYQRQHLVYSVKGACFMMSRKDYIGLGGFDEDFVSYVEETDLCHRIWLSGKKVLYEPKSIMYHWGGGDTKIMTKNEINIFRSFRNRIFSYYKNFSLKTMMRILPLHVLIAGGYSIGTLMSGQWRSAFAIQRGIITGLTQLSTMKKKREFIQKHIRRVTDDDILPFIQRNPKPWYYYYLFAGIQLYED